MIKGLWSVMVIILILSLNGCRYGAGNEGSVQNYPTMVVEPVWIRNGEPLEFEGELWYPVDGVESLLDSEIYLLGEYRNIQFFIDKVDVRPYNRLYTKFGKNKFRYFKKRLHD